MFQGRPGILDSHDFIDPDSRYIRESSGGDEGKTQNKLEEILGPLFFSARNGRGKRPCRLVFGALCRAHDAQKFRPRLPIIWPGGGTSGRDGSY